MLTSYMREILVVVHEEGLSPEEGFKVLAAFCDRCYESGIIPAAVIETSLDEAVARLKYEAAFAQPSAES